MTDNIEDQAQQQPARNAGKIIVRNAVWDMGGQFALRIANFVFTVLVVRTLGDAHFGQYSIVLAWAGLFSVIGDLGVNQYLSREMARDKIAANKLFWDTVVLRLILGVIASTITIGGAILLTDYTPDTILGIALFTTTYFFSALVAPVQSILTGNERLDILSVIHVLSQVIYMLFAGLFLFMGLNFVWLVIAGVINMPVIILIQLSIIRRNKLGPPRWQINPAMWSTLLKAGLPFAAIQLSLSFAYQVDTIFLSAYVAPEVVGWYNSAYHLTLTIVTLSRAFSGALMPTLAREHATNPASVRPWYFTSVRFIAILIIPIALGGALLNQNITLLYGYDFLPSSIALAILLWDLPFVIYNSFCGNLASSMKLERRAARIYVTIGIANVLLNLILVPQLGLIGACFATVLTDAVGSAFFFVLFRREIGSGLQANRLIRILPAVFIMGLCVFWMRDLFVIIPVIVGAAVYLMLVLVFRIFTDQETARMKSLIGTIRRRLPIPMAG